MLLAALIFFIALSIMLGFFLNYAAAEINRLETRLADAETDSSALTFSELAATSLRKEVVFWMRQSEAHYRRYQAAHDGLLAVRAMGTPNMANIGHRMQRTAKTAIEAVYAIPLNKE